MGREKGKRRRLPHSYSPYPSHLALPFSVPSLPALQHSCMKRTGDESGLLTTLEHRCDAVADILQSCQSYILKSMEWNPGLTKPRYIETKQFSQISFAASCMGVSLHIKVGLYCNPFGRQWNVEEEVCRTLQSCMPKVFNLLRNVTQPLLFDL